MVLVFNLLQALYHFGYWVVNRADFRMGSEVGKGPRAKAQRGKGAKAGEDWLTCVEIFANPDDNGTGRPQGFAGGKPLQCIASQKSLYM
jgi:hypothetical protein